MSQPSNFSTPALNKINTELQDSFFRPSEDEMRNRIKNIFTKQREENSHINARSLVERASLIDEDLFSTEKGSLS